MKYIFYTLSLLWFVQISFAQTGKRYVMLSGTIKNFNNQVEVEDMSEMRELLLPDPTHFFVPDSAGHFTITFLLASPNYFRIGRNILYLSPGDNITLYADYKDPMQATFTGTHSKENEYLRETPFPKGGSFLEAGSRIKSTVDLTVMAVAEAAKNRARSLEEHTGMDKEFVKLETARIQADILNSLDDIDVYFPYEHKLSKDSAELFHQNFEKMIAPYMEQYAKDFIDPDFLKLVVYRDVVDELIAKERNTSKNIQQVKDWIAARELAEKLKAASARETKMAFESRINQLANATYRNALNNTLSKTLALSNGDMAVDFTAADQSNTTVHASDLKGKLIYVDIWATWCGPCMEEMPAFEKLKNAYKDDPRISFISLSIDDDKTAWQTNIKKRNANGLQWIIDRAKLPAYNVLSIPRTILIGQDFRLVEMNAALPSSKKLANTLNVLLK